jgi:hypothetical protein
MNPMRPKVVNRTLQQGTLAHRVRVGGLAPASRRWVVASLTRMLDSSRRNPLPYSGGKNLGVVTGEGICRGEKRSRHVEAILRPREPPRLRWRYWRFYSTKPIPSPSRPGTPPSATCSTFCMPARFRREAASELRMPPEQATASGPAALRTSSGISARSWW